MSSPNSPRQIQLQQLAVPAGGYWITNSTTGNSYYQPPVTKYTTITYLGCYCKTCALKRALEAAQEVRCVDCNEVITGD